MTRAHRPIRSGIALIEAVVSLLVVSLLLVAALHTVGASTLGQRWNSDRLRGLHLASDLMAEVLSKQYANSGELLFGPSSAEASAGRASFDDVDDYAGLSESPPKDRTGSTMNGYGGWGREVSVVLVSPSNPSQASVLDAGAKLVTVTVKRNGKPVAKLVSVRTAAVPQ